MNKIHMMIGIQGSGKTTYSNKLSKELNINIISSDEVRNLNPNIDEKQVFPMVYDLIKENILMGKDVIFDATNITKEVRKRLYTELDKRNLDRSVYQVIAYYFEPNLKLSLERVERRNKDKNERFLPLEVIESYYNNIEEPEKNEGFSEIVYIKNYYNKEVDDIINKKMEDN